MFDNSFNHSTCYNSNRLKNCLSNNKNNSNESNEYSDKSNTSNDIDSLSNEDWESKFDVSISVLKEEYLQSINRIRNVDEKANKYLVVISIVMAGLFIVLSSSAIDNLEFKYLNSIFAFLLTLAFIATFLASLYFGILIFRAILNCFKLVDSRRMPNLEELLETTGKDNSAQYKHALIISYQESINLMDETITEKQSYIKTISEKIGSFTSALFLLLITLMVLKIIG